MAADATTILARQLGFTLTSLYQIHLYERINKDALYKRISSYILDYNRSSGSKDPIKCSAHTVREWFQGRCRPNAPVKRDRFIEALRLILQKEAGVELDPHIVRVIVECCQSPLMANPPLFPLHPEIALIGKPLHNLPRKRTTFEVVRRDLLLAAHRLMTGSDSVPIVYLRGLRNSGTSVVLQQLCDSYIPPQGRNGERTTPFERIVYINCGHRGLPVKEFITQLQQEFTGRSVDDMTRWNVSYVQNILSQTATLIALDNFYYQGEVDPLLQMLEELRSPSVAVVATDCYFERWQAQWHTATVEVRSLSFEASRALAAQYMSAQGYQLKKMLKDEELRALHEKTAGIAGLLVLLLEERCRGANTTQLINEPLLNFPLVARYLTAMFEPGWRRIEEMVSLPLYTLLRGMRDYPHITSLEDLQAIVGLSAQEVRYARNILLNQLWLKTDNRNGMAHISPHPLLSLYLKTIVIP